MCVCACVCACMRVCVCACGRGVGERRLPSAPAQAIVSYTVSETASNECVGIFHTMRAVDVFIWGQSCGEIQVCEHCSTSGFVSGSML